MTQLITLLIAIVIISNTAYIIRSSEKANKEYNLCFADAAGPKTVQKNNADKDKPKDSLQADRSKKAKVIALENSAENQHLPVPEKEVYTAEIDNYVPLLLMIAIALIFYYSRSKNKSSH